MRKLFFAVAATVCMFSCNKSSETAGNTDFQPFTAGSNWTYVNNPGGISIITATNSDTVALGRTYKVFVNSNGPNYYMAKSGSSYYRFGTLQGVFPSGIEELYLKDDQPVNASWSLPDVTVNFSGTPTVIKPAYKIANKGMTMTVQGKSYSNVTYVRLNLTTNVFGIEVDLGGGDFYYAGGIGMISTAINITAGSQAISQSSELSAYEIK